MKTLCVLAIAVFAAANCCNVMNEVERMETAFNIDDDDKPIYKLELSEGTNSSYIISTTNEDPFRALVHVSPPDPLTCGPPGLIPRQGDEGVMKRSCPGILLFGKSKRQLGFTVIAPECGCVDIRVQTFIADETDKPIRFIDSSLGGPLSTKICAKVNNTTTRDIEDIKQNLRERPLVCSGTPERALPMCPPPPFHHGPGHHGPGHHKPGHHGIRRPRPGHHGRGHQRPGRHHPKRAPWDTMEVQDLEDDLIRAERVLSRNKRHLKPEMPPRDSLCPSLVAVWEKIREQCCHMAGPNYHTCANSIIMENEDNLESDTDDDDDEFDGDFEPDTETAIGGRDCCNAGRNHAAVGRCTLFKRSQWWAQNREAIGLFKGRKCSQIGMRCCMRAQRLTSKIGLNEEALAPPRLNESQLAHECCTAGQTLSPSRCRLIRASAWWEEKKTRLPLFAQRKCLGKATHCCRMKSKQVINSGPKQYRFEPVQVVEDLERDDDEDDDDEEDDLDREVEVQQIEGRRMTFETCFEMGKQEGQYIKKDESCMIKRPVGWRRKVRRNFRRNNRRLCNLKFNYGCEQEKKARFEEGVISTDPFDSDGQPLDEYKENLDLPIVEPSWDEFDTENSQTEQQPEYQHVNIVPRDENEVEIDNTVLGKREYNEIPL